MFRILLATAFSFSTLASMSQCDVGQVEINLSIYTDSWPYETYWQIVPSGNDCGEGVIIEGANTNVNCSGQAADDGPEGYPGNTVVQVGPFCLEEGASYDLIFIDSYGDGGLTFEIYENGALTQLFSGQGFGNTLSFIPGQSLTPIYDQPCGAELLELNNEIILDNTNAIAGFGEIAPAGGGCGNYGQWCEGASTKSVWAYFVASANQGYEITTCGSLQGFDTQIALWKSNDCSSFGSFELISANDDTAIPCSTSDVYSSRLFVSCLEEGATYYIQVDGYYGAAGEVSLGLFEYDATPELVASVGNISCPVNKGDSGNGSIYPYIIGEGVNFTAEWSGPNGFSSFENSISGLNAGVYSVTVNSACGIQYLGTYEITEPAYWNVFLTSEPPSCGASLDGELTVSVSGATSPYNIIWNGPGGSTFSGASINQLDDGEYNGQITDANNCLYPLSYQLNAVNDFEFEVTENYILCDDAQLSIDLTTQYSYFWFDGSNGNSYLIDGNDWNVGQNNILVTVSNDQGCNDVVPISFIVDDCTGVLEQNNNELKVYPNPSNGLINIHWTGESVASIQVIDALGKVIYQVSNMMSANFIMLENLASGLYVVKVSSDDQDWRSTVIVK